MMRVVTKRDAPVTLNGADLSGKGVQCCECGRVELYSRKVAISKGIPPGELRKKFYVLGWHQDRKGWHCPDCIEKEKLERIEARARSIELSPPTLAAVVQMPKPQPEKETPVALTVVNHDPVAESIAKMTPADRRRIFREIDVVWDDAKGRYTGGATDKTLADAMKVPRIWVETIRRESFGNSADNDEIEALQVDLAKIEGKITLQVDACIKAASVLEASLKEVRALSDRLQIVEKAVGLKR